MEYIIKYNFNGQEYESRYIPTIDFREKDASDIAYDALMRSLDYHKLKIEEGCLRHIELFIADDQKNAIYSAITYTPGMGFLLTEAE